MNATKIKEFFTKTLSALIVKYVSKEALKRLRKYVVASILGFSGPMGWIANLALDYVIKKGWLSVETHHEVNKKKEAYDKIKNDPNSTVEDIGKSFHDLLNN